MLYVSPPQLAAPIANAPFSDTLGLVHPQNTGTAPRTSLSILSVYMPLPLPISCRNVEVSWEHSTQSSSGKVRWASKSQAKQRAGRTGRTCSGTVFRLVPRGVFNSFPDFETPSLLLASLREESLRLCCSRARATSDAHDVLRNCLDPPKQQDSAR